MKKRVLFIFLFLLLFSCNKQDNNLFNYVNPFIGTGGHGHTYPEFLNLLEWYISPIQQKDGMVMEDIIFRFHYIWLHTHLSELVFDYADVLLMPTTESEFN